MTKAFEVGQKLLLQRVGRIVTGPTPQWIVLMHDERRQLSAGQPLLQHGANLLDSLFAAGGGGVQFRQSKQLRRELTRRLWSNDNPVVQGLVLNRI